VNLTLDRQRMALSQKSPRLRNLRTENIQASLFYTRKNGGKVIKKQVKGFIKMRLLRK